MIEAKIVLQGLNRRGVAAVEKLSKERPTFREKVFMRLNKIRMRHKLEGGCLTVYYNLPNTPNKEALKRSLSNFTAEKMAFHGAFHGDYSFEVVF
jgi:hypothetical protein